MSREKNRAEILNQNQIVGGAPEEIRTPDPQIRRLTPFVEKPANFCKPGAFSHLAHQRVSAPIANRERAPRLRCPDLKSRASDAPRPTARARALAAARRQTPPGGV